ncbi:alpha-1,2-fucosyltransferase [Candidatus Dependentiae bacterium]
MIIIKIKGGLGNQIFQYAFGRYLSLKTGRKLKLDLSYFKSNSYRKFNLDKFNIVFDGVIDFKSKILLKSSIYFPRIFKNNFCIINNNTQYFDPSVIQRIVSNKKCFLNGYWQSESFFSEIDDFLKKELNLKKEYFNNLNKTVLRKILNTNSVAIHVRRGDYIWENLNKPYNVCDLKYYASAIKIVKDKIKNPFCFIFSDDIEWVKKNLIIELPKVYVTENSVYKDFALMSFCKHNIMANSTFSWWASRLNSNLNKIVVAPHAWRTDGVREELHTDYQIRI